MSKGRKIFSWILIGLLGFLFVMSATMKFAGGIDITNAFSHYGLTGKEWLIGAGELISAILYVIPKTSSLGVLLLSGHMGGAIATHMEHGEMYVAQTIILLLIWFAHWLRNPDMLSSFRKK